MSGFRDEDRDSSTDDDWDKSSDEEEEKKEVKAAPTQKKKGKAGLSEAIAKREAREAAARKAQQAQVAELGKLTPAERQKKIEEDELMNAAEFIDIKDPESIDLNSWKPRSKHDFQMYAELLTKKTVAVSVSPFYTDFVCDMVRESIKSLSLDDTRKVEQVLKVQINELCKSNKTSKKKNKKGSLNAGAGKGRGVDIDNADDYDDDFDDLI